MTPDEPDTRDILRYFDGELDGAEMERLNESLRESAELRAEFREVAEQAVLLGDLGRGTHLTTGTSETVQGASVTPIPLRTRSRWRQMEHWALAAMLVLLLGGLFWLSKQERASDPIATLEVADGAVRWTDSGGRINEDVVEGMELGAGSLSIASADGMVQVRFPDETFLTFVGETEVHLSEREGRKWFVLDRGTVTAEVSEQRDGAPLTLVTPTAEIEVLGTVLSVEADSGETSLSVDEGRVAIRHLINGERVEVPAGQRVVAALDPGVSMAPGTQSALPSQWALDPSRPGVNRVTKGKWVRSDSGRILQGEYYRAGRRPDGDAYIRRGIAINGPVRMGIPFVQLGPESRIRLRYRADDGSDGGVSVFLGTQRESGRFGGNFEFRVRAEESEGVEGGFREVVIPIAAFELVGSLRDRDRDYSLETNALSKIMVSVGRERMLEVESVSVDAGP